MLAARVRNEKTAPAEHAAFESGGRLAKDPLTRPENASEPSLPNAPPDRSNAQILSAQYAAWIGHFEDLQPKIEAVDGEAISFLLWPGEAHSITQTLESLRAQTAGGWEVLVAAELAALADSRIVFVPELARLSKAHALPRLAERARHDWLAVLDPGDTLTSTAVGEMSARLVAGAVGVAYCDEDTLDNEGQRGQPYFKPSWSPQLLQTFNYFGRLTVLNRHILSGCGGFEAADASAVEWMANLRAAEGAETAGLEIVRIERVLCHRAFDGPRARPGPATPEAAEHRAALTQYWLERRRDAKVSTLADGTYHAVWPLDAPPLVSIIIPSHENADVLRRCLEGILHRTNYGNLEIIIVENNSKDPETWSYYEELSTEPKVRIIRLDGAFNYSRTCNFGAEKSRGQLLLFLNNDVEVLTSDWLSELVRMVTLPGVGIVGTKLRYPDGRLQHAGVLVGIHLFALAYHHADEDEFGVFGSPNLTRNWIAIMGACQMVRREVFNLVDGFDETFRIANNDVEFCIQAHLLGWRTAYTPHAALVHHEGVTRGRENPPGDMTRSANLMIRAEIGEDPYLHPELSGFSAPLRLRAPGEPSLREFMDINIAIARGWEPEVDLADDGAIGAATRRSAKTFTWRPQLVHTIVDEWGAARWLVDLLRRSAEMRRRFPRALCDGPTGCFGIWITGEEGSRRGLSETARDHIRRALSAGLGSRPLQSLLTDADTIRANPLILLPPGRARLLRWLFPPALNGRSLRLEEIWWFLITLSEAPEEWLTTTYRLTPRWQEAHPAGLTGFGREALAAWIARTYDLSTDAPWLQPASWKPGLTPLEELRLVYAARAAGGKSKPEAIGNEEDARLLLTHLSADEDLTAEQRRWCVERLDDGSLSRLQEPGANLIGHFCYPSGLKVSLEAIANGIEAASGRVSRRDLITSPADEPRHCDFLGLEPFDVTIIHVQPEPFFAAAYVQAGLSPRRPRPRRVGYWYWELEEAPARWAEIAGDLDEIWAATTFVSKALRKVCSQPVLTLFPGVRLPAFAPKPKKAFGLREDERFTFLFSFHMASILERKNPFGLIEAFRLAFDSSEPVDLVLKTTSSPAHDEKMAELRAASAGGNIVILDDVMSMQDAIALTNACDAYVSLHRSEGLGLTLAEAMLLGKPVIATRYSGNLDFMDDETSLLVDFEMTAVGKNTPPYDDTAKWAAPSIRHAASLMRRLYEERDFATALGARARAHATRHLSIERAGERIVERLKILAPGR